MEIQMLLPVLLVLGCFDNGSGASNSSAEHRIRKFLLTNYDKSVIPAQKRAPLNVEFGLKIKKLIKVDNKEQLLSIDTWIVMRWNNSFLIWEKSQFDGVRRVQFAPTEIWFPDISLYNNGDQEVPRAGGTSIFLSDVSVRSDGECVYSGPATFKVNCEMKLNTYPFDHQRCEMRFGSFNYASNKLKVVIFKTKKSKSDRFIASGDWDLRDLRPSTGETDHGHCCPYKFSEARYVVDMSRRFKYHLFYLVAPCAIIAIMALFSFFIPTESGERIGFVTTLMLGMMVFLLIIPESLPESSKSIPVLGVLMMMTLVMIGLVLLATILIIKCFYSKREPPKFLKQKLGRTKSHKAATPVPERASVGVLDNINLRAALPKSQEIEFKPSFEAFKEISEADNEATWQYISRVFDKIMFFVFLVLAVIMFSVTLTQRD